MYCIAKSLSFMEPFYDVVTEIKIKPGTHPLNHYPEIAVSHVYINHQPCALDDVPNALVFENIEDCYSMLLTMSMLGLEVLNYCTLSIEP